MSRSGLTYFLCTSAGSRHVDAARRKNTQHLSQKNGSIQSQKTWQNRTKERNFQKETRAVRADRLSVKKHFWPRPKTSRPSARKMIRTHFSFPVRRLIFLSFCLSFFILFASVFRFQRPPPKRVHRIDSQRINKTGSHFSCSTWEINEKNRSKKPNKMATALFKVGDDVDGWCRPFMSSVERITPYDLIHQTSQTTDAHEFITPAFIPSM